MDVMLYEIHKIHKGYIVLIFYSCIIFLLFFLNFQIRLGFPNDNKLSAFKAFCNKKTWNMKKLSNEHECQRAKILQHNFELTYQRRLSLRGSTWNFILWKVSFFNIKVNPFNIPLMIISQQGLSGTNLSFLELSVLLLLLALLNWTKVF